MPGVGISIGLSRLFYILNEMNYITDVNNGPADVLIIPMTDGLSYAINISGKLRNKGIRTQIYFEDKKIKNKISFANRTNIIFALFLGEDEITSQKVTVKNLESGEQLTLELDHAISLIKDQVNSIDKQKIINIENKKADI